MYTCICMYVSKYLSTIHSPIHPTIHPFIHPYICSYFSPPRHLSTYLTVCLFTNYSKHPHAPGTHNIHIYIIIIPLLKYAYIKVVR